MENKIKTAAEIVTKLANADEPYYHEGRGVNVQCWCALCPIRGTDEEREGWRVKLLDPKKSDDGYSIMGHHAECAWRQAVEYVQASK